MFLPRFSKLADKVLHYVSSLCFASGKVVAAKRIKFLGVVKHLLQILDALPFKTIPHISQKISLHLTNGRYRLLFNRKFLCANFAGLCRGFFQASFLFFDFFWRRRFFFWHALIIKQFL